MDFTDLATDVGKLIEQTEKNFVIARFNALSVAEKNRLTSLIRKGEGGGELLDFLIRAPDNSYQNFVKKNWGIETARTPSMPKGMSRVTRIVEFQDFFKKNLHNDGSPMEMIPVG